MNSVSSNDQQKLARAAPFSLRLSAEERARLNRDAAGVSLSAYIKDRLFGADAPHRITRGKAPVKDHQALGRLLGQLGSSRLANNLHQLAKAANTGSLPVTPDTESALHQACAEIAVMRSMLMRALCTEAAESPEKPKAPAPDSTLMAAFAQSARPEVLRR